MTDHLRAGDNLLEIAVTNLWVNRMIGELNFPDGFPGQTDPKAFFPKNSIKSRRLETRKIKPSGLAGPVRIEIQVHQPLGQVQTQTQK